MANVNLSPPGFHGFRLLQLRGLDAQVKLLNETIKVLEASLIWPNGDSRVASPPRPMSRWPKHSFRNHRAQLVDVGVARAQYEHTVVSIADYKLPTFSIPFSPLDLRFPPFPSACRRNSSSAVPTLPPPSAALPPQTSKSGSAVSAFLPPPSASPERRIREHPRRHLASGSQRPVVPGRPGGRAPL